MIAKTTEKTYSSFGGTAFEKYLDFPPSLKHPKKRPYSPLNKGVLLITPNFART
jgi:hypothetical protein